MRWIYAIFWIVVGTGLIWQFLTYNTHLNEVQAAKGPTQEHYYFNSHSDVTTTVTAPAKVVDGANVRQIDFSSTLKSPVPGQFTCHVTLKNYGNQKATAIQVMVSPFRGEPVREDREAHAKGHGMSDVNNDMYAQINAWVAFPDLDPGQQMTQSAVFVNIDGQTPGDNLRPQIIFKSVKPEAPQPVKPAPVLSPNL